jgi:multidrug efflux system outer membrane protein
MNKIIIGGLLLLTACKTPQITERQGKLQLPEHFAGQTVKTEGLPLYKLLFTDQYLQGLIDRALLHNQELEREWQEVVIRQNEVMARKGEYLPFVTLNAGMGLEKGAHYTAKGAVEEGAEIKPGKALPDPLQDYGIAALANWELDVWHKLRNAKKAASYRYLATVEGRNFVQTQVVAEIASSYFELLAMDQELAILQQNFEIQSNALQVVKLLKSSTRTNELAVLRFQAQVLKTQAMQFDLKQQIIETENKVNYLVGRLPQKIERGDFDELQLGALSAGVPADLLSHRPDIKQAELELLAQKLDVKSAKARFYPSVGISAGIGLQAFNPVYLLKPQSILYHIAGDMVAPMVNKRAITADYLNANAKQVQALVRYEQTLLRAHLEVENQLSAIKNLEDKFALKTQEVEALTRSVEVSNNLFRSTRADYMEVLLTQREVLDVKFEWVETKMKQFQAQVALYKALGGGWEK